MELYFLLILTILNIYFLAKKKIVPFATTQTPHTTLIVDELSGNAQDLERGMRWTVTIEMQLTPLVTDISRSVLFFDADAQF